MGMDSIIDLKKSVINSEGLEDTNEYDLQQLEAPKTKEIVVSKPQLTKKLNKAVKFQKLCESIDTSMSSRRDPFKDQIGMMRMMDFSRKQSKLATKVMEDAFKDIDAKTIYKKELTITESYKNRQLKHLEKD